MAERPREIHAITLSNVQRAVESLKSEMRALRSGHLKRNVVMQPTATLSTTTGVKSVSRRDASRDIRDVCNQCLVHSITRLSRSKKHLRQLRC